MLATFCTAPAIRDVRSYVISEVVGALRTGILRVAFGETWSRARNSGRAPAGLFIPPIGLSLGGTTVYAINPVRDLSPRIVHVLLPISDRRDADWSYA